MTNGGLRFVLQSPLHRTALCPCRGMGMGSGPLARVTPEHATAKTLSSTSAQQLSGVQHHTNLPMWESSPSPQVSRVLPSSVAIRGA